LAIKNVEVKFRLIDQSFQTIRTLIRSSVVLGLGYLGEQAVESLSGETTSIIVNGSLKLLADIHVVIPYAIAGLLGAWGVGERRLRQRKTDALQGRIKTLEIAVDPKRSSSNLTTHGKTNPKDRRP